MVCVGIDVAKDKQEFNDQMCDQLSFKEYEDPFKNVADFDDDDSPEVPADSMRK